jgi:hypothetical protein
MNLVPIGHDLGVLYDGTASVRQIRVGAEIEELTEPEYQTWRSAEPDDALVKRRLLADTTDAVAFASTHRLLPLALGLGNTKEEPWLFAAGLLYQPMVAMTGPLYDLWQWAHLSPDLWSACQEAAAVAVAAGVAEPEQTDPAQVLAGALEVVPQLLTAKVACFDVRIEGLR